MSLRTRSRPAPPALPLTRRGFLTLTALGLASALSAPRVRASGAPRVVSIGGAITECVYALGQAHLLVGADSTSLYPAAAQALPRVGYLRSLSAEGLLSLAPRLILAAEGAGPPMVVAQVRRAGVQWVTLADGHTPQAPADKLRAVGAALDQPGRAAERIRQFEAEWAHTRTALAGLRGRPRAIFVMAHGGPTLNLAGRDTAAEAMLGLAGCDNPLEFTGYKTISAEALLAAAPEVIVTTTQSLDGLGGQGALLARPGIADTPAARRRHVVALDALLLLGFGPRLPQAVWQVALRARGLT